MDPSPKGRPPFSQPSYGPSNSCSMDQCNLPNPIHAISPQTLTLDHSSKT